MPAKKKGCVSKPTATCRRLLAQLAKVDEALCDLRRRCKQVEMQNAPSPTQKVAAP